MKETLELAEQCFVRGRLADAHSVLEGLRQELSQLRLPGREDELKHPETWQAFLRFKATVASCRRRDQMLFAIYSAPLREAYLA